MIAHVGPLPVEELLTSLSGVGVSLLVTRAWIAERLRR